MKYKIKWTFHSGSSYYTVSGTCEADWIERHYTNEIESATVYTNIRGFNMWNAVYLDDAKMEMVDVEMDEEMDELVGI